MWINWAIGIGFYFYGYETYWVFPRKREGVGVRFYCVDFDKSIASLSGLWVYIGRYCRTHHHPLPPLTRFWKLINHYLP